MPSQLNHARDALAAAIVALHFERHPALQDRFGPLGRDKCRQDALYHLQYLAQAVEHDSQQLFNDYVAWVKALLAGLGIPLADLQQHLCIMEEVLPTHLDAEEASIAANMVQTARHHLEFAPTEPACALQEEMPLAEVARHYLKTLLSAKRHEASTLILDQFDNGTPVKDIYLHIFQPCLREVGRLWQTGKISVAQEHYCTAVTQSIMSRLYPYIFNQEKNGQTVLATCVSDELHEIGVRMIADFFEMHGWNAHYLGANVPNNSVIDFLRKHHVDLVAISATMTTHIPKAIALIQAIRQDPANPRLKILVGGYPFNIDPELWRKTGADGTASDAMQTLVTAKKILPSPICRRR